MMKIFVPKESAPEEERVPMIPANVDRLVKAGAAIEIESGLGASLGLGDDAYEKVGATVAPDPAAALAGADIVVRLGKPNPDEVEQLKKGSIHVSYVDPFFDEALVRSFAAELWK